MPGYVVRVDTDEVDASRFEAMIRARDVSARSPHERRTSLRRETSGGFGFGEPKTPTPQECSVAQDPLLFRGRAPFGGPLTERGDPEASVERALGPTCGST